MDTSETYIKMCDCEEIQAESATPRYHQFGMGDWYVDDGGVGCIGIGGKHYFNDLHKENMPMKFIWLPRQDQLQEMLLEHSWGNDRSLNDVVVLLDEFQDWILNDCTGLEWSHKRIKLSMEQLWLAFVMKEKYDKGWDGQNWIKELIDGREVNG